MNIPETKIKVIYKRAQYQEVEISVCEGYEAIKTPDQLVSFVKSINDDPYQFIDGENWHDCPEQGATVETISYSEA